MLTTCLAALLLAATAAAADDATAVVERMRAVLEPARPSVRRMTITLHGGEGGTAQWTAGQARKRLPDGRRILTVMLAPESVRGVAFMVGERPDGVDAQWIYLPTVRRVRQVFPASKYQSFLNTDFTLADFGFIGREPNYRLLGSEKVDGVRAHVLEEIPRERWYYARILSWVSGDTGLPLRREFFAPSGELWKVERFEQVTRIDGVPTPLHLRMEDVREGGSSEIRIVSVRYDESIPDAIFETARLPEAAAWPLWDAAAGR